MKRIVILGSTGSIGSQTLEVVRQHPDRLQVVGLAAHRNLDALRRQAEEFGVRRIAVYDEEVGRAGHVPFGLDGLVELAKMPEAGCVVVAVAGVVGLKPTVAAVKVGKSIALASKEVLVAAGEIVMPLIKAHGHPILPIDSEHSALFQCMQGYQTDQIDRLILTASGGPFRGRSRAELARVTLQEALNHPTWRMGGKITIDSATMMNKGLEIIEAKWMFGTTADRVDVVVHPQSVVHSLVRFKDGSVLAQMGWPDMRLPIQYALLYPERKPNQLLPWNPVDTPNLTFEEVDESVFPATRIARDAAGAGGTMPAVLNAANEEAVQAFLRGECGFLEITDLVQAAMDAHTVGKADLDHIVEADGWARAIVRERLASN